MASLNNAFRARSKRISDKPEATNIALINEAAKVFGSPLATACQLTIERQMNTTGSYQGGEQRRQKREQFTSFELSGQRLKAIQVLNQLTADMQIASHWAISGSSRSDILLALFALDVLFEIASFVILKFSAYEHSRMSLSRHHNRTLSLRRSLGLDILDNTILHKKRTLS